MVVVRCELALLDRLDWATCLDWATVTVSLLVLLLATRPPSWV